MTMGSPSLASKVRALVGELSIIYSVGRRWSRPMPQPDSPEPLSEVHLYAVIPTWCEGDVIASTVYNAFAQGRERVFLLHSL